MSQNHESLHTYKLQNNKHHRNIPDRIGQAYPLKKSLRHCNHLALCGPCRLSCDNLSFRSFRHFARRWDRYGGHHLCGVCSWAVRNPQPRNMGQDNITTTTKTYQQVETMSLLHAVQLLRQVVLFSSSAKTLSFFTLHVRLWAFCGTDLALIIQKLTVTSLRKPRIKRFTRHPEDEIKGVSVDTCVNLCKFILSLSLKDIICIILVIEISVPIGSTRPLSKVKPKNSGTMKIRSNFKKFIFIKVQLTFCAAGSTSIGVLLQSSSVYTQCPNRAAHHSLVINCYQLFRNYQQLLSTLSEHQQLVTSCHYVCAVLALAFSCASRTLKNLNSCWKCLEVASSSMDKSADTHYQASCWQFNHVQWPFEGISAAVKSRSVFPFQKDSWDKQGLIIGDMQFSCIV